MMQKDVALPKRRKNIWRRLRQAPLTSYEWLELEVRAIDVAVQMHEAREVHNAGRPEHLPVLQFEHRLQALNDLAVCVGFNLQSNRIAFAPVMQLRANRFKYAARLFFLKIEVAVAS